MTIRIASLKQTFFLLALVMVLLWGLLSWTLHMTSAPITPTQTNHALHLNRGCPPPPYDCW